jgi:hypothetical protein
MRKLLITGVAALAAITFAAPAHADTQGYFDYLSDHGVANPQGNAMNGTTYLSQGQQECAALRNGKSEEWLIGQLEHVMDRADSDLIVVGAHQYLCPGA